MIYAAIKLILNPLPCSIARQQRNSACDQVFKIEQTTFAFEIVIALQKIVDQGQSRQIEPYKAQFFHPVEPLLDLLSDRVEIFLKVRKQFFYSRRRHPRTGFGLAV